MAEPSAARVLGAAALAAAGAACAIWSGAPPVAALLAVAAGAAALALAAPPKPAEPVPPEEPPAEAPHMPDFAALIDAIEEPLLVVRERRVLIANAAARALLGQHIEGSDVRLAIRHPAAAERLGDSAPAEPQRTELVGLGDLGRQWEMSVATLPDGSRLVRLADQSQARAAEQMRVDFVANASHELRTPLATLLGFLETLEDEAAGGDAETRARFIAIMSGEAMRMRDLLDDLMSLSRIEAERFTLPRETVDLLPLLEEVKLALKPLAAGRKIDIRNEAGAASVTGDRGQLAQLFNNLIVNALKYGRPKTAVTVRFDRPDAELVRIRIVDQGEGIAPEHIPRLTERFYRVDPGRSRQVGGTGLGLAIVKHIVLRHRGRLDIASEPGIGTTASVYLPLAETLS
jgi:two-component system phosphate regulon sensor histidine kinase PhoR